MIDTSALLAEIIPLARLAGEKIMDVFHTDDLAIQQKRDWSPVTRADLEANRVIIEGLTRLTPEIPIISEEDPAAPFAERTQWPYLWLIDPLDGTRSFIEKHRDFSVNIALVQGSRAILGVVHAPATGVCYYAEEQNGPGKIEADGSRKTIHTRKVGDKAVVVLGSRSHGSNIIDSFIARLGEHSMIRMGSALKSCLVAEGKADIYPRFGPTSEWDTAAAQIIVELAGGAMVDLAMNPLKYNYRDSLVNPHFCCIGDDSYNWESHLKNLPS